MNSINSSFGSVSGGLCSSMLSALSLEREEFILPETFKTNVDNNTSPNRGLARSLAKEAPVPIDFEWLLKRCFGDEQLVLQVLLSFQVQGTRHICSLHEAVVSSEYEKVMFHAV